MCNNCNCENYLKCSIVGFSTSPAFCCEKCYNYDELHTCLTAQLNRKTKIDLEEKHIEIFPRFFCLKQHKKSILRKAETPFIDE
ncbi:MAG: hypothetical protein P8Y70_01385 [Candidatus Lokiarchaeota archaeon]